MTITLKNAKTLLTVILAIAVIAVVSGCQLVSGVPGPSDKAALSTDEFEINEPPLLAESANPGNVSGNNAGQSPGDSVVPSVSPPPETGKEGMTEGPSGPAGPAKPVEVPILNYHAVSDETFGIDEIFVRPSVFEQELQYLKDNGYTPIHFEDLENLEGIEKPVILTFDDGYSDNYSVVYPLLKKYNFKAVVFPVVNLLNTEHYLTRDEILEMRDLVSFQNHTMNHRELIYLDLESAEKEMADASKELEALTGQKVTVIAYPIGLYNEQIINIAKKYFKYAVTIDQGIYTVGGNTYTIPRIYMERSDTLETFVNKLKGLEL